MSVGRYLSGARKALNGWAESLPGGKLWSTDLGEAYRIQREIREPFRFLLPPATACYAFSVGCAFLKPSYESLALSLAAGAMTAFGWLIPCLNKVDNYDMIGKMAEQGMIIVPDGESKGEKGYRKLLEVWLKDHGKWDEYRTARGLVKVAETAENFENN